MKSLKNRRIHAALTQCDLAQILGVTQGVIASWESGRVRPRADKLPEIAKVLGCTIDELFQKENEKEVAS